MGQTLHCPEPMRLKIYVQKKNAIILVFSFLNLIEYDMLMIPLFCLIDLEENVWNN